MNNQSSNLPGFCIIIDELISEIAKERGRDPEVFKAALLEKIKAREAGTAATAPTSTKTKTSKMEAFNDLYGRR